ncbi:MAG: type VII secretion protein EssC, partial [Dysgonamonadaceae bacterium]|nr:type VII secretion protein EssC [Dysgonamonadaceae bacterium]
SGNHAKIYKLGAEFHVADINSTNGTFLNNKLIRDAVLNNDDIISIGIYKIIFKKGSLSFQNTGDDLTINIVSKRKAASKDYPYFMRSPRLKLEIPTGEIEIQAPPNLGTKPEINWLTVLLPPISMILIMVSVVLFTGGNPVSLMYTAPMSLMGIMVSLLSYRSQKKKHIQKEHLRLERYNEHLQETIKEIEDKIRAQFKALSLAHPDTKECMDIVHNAERRLWERKPLDDDFMSLRLGSGIMDFNVQLRIPKQTVHLDDDDLLNKPQEIADKYRYLKDAPIIFDMLNFPSGGVVGNRKDCIHLIRNMIVQAATHHCYDELKIITIFPKNELLDWDWIKWLPHSFNDNRSERYMACNTYGATDIFKQFDEILTQRLREIKEEDDYRNNYFKLPFYLFIIADRTLVEGQTIMKYLTGNNKKMGIGTLFLYDDISLLSRDCAVIMDVRNAEGIIYNKDNAADKKSFKIDKVKDFEFDAFSRALAPVRVSSMTEELMLPSTVTFLEGHGVKKPDEINIADNWVNSRAYKSMAVAIGVKANGEQFMFDIHEKFHGPHGLVAGMTGSGKSEMVQTWILSMALKFSPQDVSFVLIDFKGTGLILPFMNMPHLAGTISDLDTNINRNLIALENELSRRKALLDSVGVNNIISYLKLYKDGKTKEPLSFLFVIIDEFAEFKVQFPDFMTVVNRIFAIGRTLGVFAVLLTQKPSGVVDDKMHANTRFRWCLKVANTADSKDMIKHPEAAKITNPGRAYVQVGEDEIFELVQSYWSGAPYNPHKTTKTVAKPRISVIDIGGRRISYDTYEKTLGFKSQLSEIDVIIQYIDKYVKDNDIAKAGKIWMQKLPDNIPLNNILKANFDGERWPDGNGTINPIVGMLDDPHTQSQYPLRFNLSQDGHHVIFGAPSTGKTTMLQTLVMSLVLSYSPQDVNIYIMDFGGWSMGVFKDFPHVGGVANDNDSERIEKTARLIIKELDQRKRKFAAEGVGSIVSYREATGERLPNIVLVLDNFAPVINLYPSLEQFFINLTREGGNYGVYFVTTANNTMALGFKLGQNIKMAVSLQMTDKSDYSSIVGKTDGLEPEKAAGRGLAKGNPPLEFQAALPIEGMNENERVSKIKDTAILMDKKWEGKKAKPIPIMPAIINFGTVEIEDIAVGLTYKDVEPIGISFAGQHYIIVSGKPMSGKSNMLKVIAKQMDAKKIVFDSGTALKNIEGLCEHYINNVTDFDKVISDMVPILQQRKDEYSKDNSIRFEPILIIIDDLKLCFELIKDETAKRLDAIIRLGKGLNVNLLVAGNSDDVSKLYNQGESFTMGLVNSQTSILLGGNFRTHNVFKANVPYSEQDVLLDEYEGYVIHREKALRFKAMYEL